MANIRNKDLNLLATFVVVAEELNLRKASARLGLSQPALSHSLARLRDQFGDPLFTRGQRGLLPTPRVAELLPQVRAVLDATVKLYEPAQAFDPSKLKRKAIIASTTYAELKIISQLAHSLERAAPGVSLETYSLGGGFPKKELETGEYDVAIAAYFSKLPEGFRVKTLFKEPFVCVATRNHPYHRSKKNLDDYLRCKHFQIEVPPGVVAPVDQYLEQKKNKRALTLRVGNFLTPASIIKETDLVLTCPLSLAQHYADLAHSEISELPFKLPYLETKMVWHERNHKDKFHSWFREQISKAIN